MFPGIRSRRHSRPDESTPHRAATTRGTLAPCSPWQGTGSSRRAEVHSHNVLRPHGSRPPTRGWSYDTFHPPRYALPNPRGHLRPGALSPRREYVSSCSHDQRHSRPDESTPHRAATTRGNGPIAARPTGDSSPLAPSATRPTAQSEKRTTLIFYLYLYSAFVRIPCISLLFPLHVFCYSGRERVSSCSHDQRHSRPDESTPHRAATTSGTLAPTRVRRIVQPRPGALSPLAGRGRGREVRAVRKSVPTMSSARPPTRGWSYDTFHPRATHFRILAGTYARHCGVSVPSHGPHALRL